MLNLLQQTGCRLALPLLLGIHASSLLSQGTRSREPEGPAAEQPRRPRAFLHRQLEVRLVTAPEEESDLPYELTRDPVPDSELEASGTGPIPAYLKGNPYRLSFTGGDYIPPRGERIDPLLLELMRQRGPGRSRTYGFVMFQGRITAAKQRRIMATGVKLLNFHTFQSFAAVIPIDTVPRLLASPDVRWVGYARPAQKMDAGLRHSFEARVPGKLELFVSVFVPDTMAKPTRVRVAAPADNRLEQTLQAAAYQVLPGGPFQKALEADGAEVTGYLAAQNTFILRATLESVERMLRHDFVHGLELVPMSRSYHDRSTRQIGVDRMRGVASSNGSAIVAGIIDTGVHMGAGKHVDLNKFGVGWDYLSSGGAFNDTSGHGTHVAGTFFGTGAGNDRYRGCAPGVGGSATTRVFVGKAIPGPFSAAISAITRFRSSFTSGAQTTPRPRVVNNSWGSTAVPSSGYYGTDSTSIAVDTSSYTNNQLYVFAAGNSGSGGSFGLDRLRSVGLPAVAKNAFTVANQYDWHGTNSIRMNSQRTLNNTGLSPGWFEALEVRPSTSYPSLEVKGFRMRLRAGSATTISTYLYLANTRGQPAGPPVRTGTMAVGTTEGFYRTEFSPSYTMAAGKRFFIAYRTGSTGTLMRPWTSAGTDRNVFARPVTQTTWNGPFPRKVVYIVDCETEAGETTESSSKGPTRDGRVKPNIAAPGRWITSCRTKTTNQYSTKSGTSMASPHVAGSAAVMMHRFASARDNPPVAKALLAAGANPHGGMTSITSSMNSWGSIYRQGLGQVDPYKSTFTVNSPQGWQGFWATTTLNSGHAGGAIDLLVPNDADRIMDVAPFSAGFNTGEYSSTRAWDTWEWRTFWTTTTMNAVRGKTMRIKFYPRVRPAVGTTVKIGLGVIMYRGDQTPLAAASLSAPVAVKPNQSFALQGTAVVPATVTTNGVLELTSLGGFSVTGMRFTTPEGVLRSYPPTNNNFTDTILGWTLGNSPYFASSGHRSIDWTLQKAAAGTSLVCAALRSDNRTDGDSTTAASACKWICVDGSSPPAIAGLSSLSHTLNAWSSNTTLRMRWNSPTDLGCAGIGGLATKLSLGATSVPTIQNLNGALISQNLAVAQSSSAQYYNIRGVDKARNFSASTASWGPFFIDTTAPRMTAVSIDNGASYTKNLGVLVRAAASDTPSGPAELRYSANNLNWSLWRPYTSANVSRNLAASGGNALEGTKSQWVQVRDKAGNVSTSMRDTIVYDKTPPRVTSVTIANGATYTRTLGTVVRVSASDNLSGVAQMRFSANGTVWSAWQPYSLSNVPINLSSNGGNTLQGTKRIFAQVIDSAGNLSLSGSDTIIYDSIAPVITSVALNGGASYTSSLLATATVVSTGAPKSMRYSMNGMIWSGWAAYTTSLRVDLAAFGGNSSTGSKTVRVQVRDAALNVSLTKTDSIIYLPRPAIATASPSSVTVVNKTRMRLAGTGFAGVNQVIFGAKIIRSDLPDDWFTGYFKVLSDTAIDLWSPQDLAPGSYALRVRNAGFASGAISVSVLHNRTRLLGIPTQLARGRRLEILVHRDGMPAATFNLMTLSASPRPLVIPGLISLGHGGNATTFIDPSFMVLPGAVVHHPTTRTARWSFPVPRALPAMTPYFQSLMFDPLNSGKRPITVSSFDRVRIY
ncbi:MAG: S8 family serine peptidase [Planctomycetota bacterium]